MDIIISNSGDKPIYEQIKDEIKSHILKGEIKPGEALPGMRSLAKDLRISVITTKRAYNDLEAEGFITTVPGKGSFVSKVSREFVKEEQMRDMEDHLEQAVVKAKVMHLSAEDLFKLINIFYEE